MSSDLQLSRLCPDWVVSINSGVHSCKNAGWFSEYTPFRSIAIDKFGNELHVEGVGLVKLPVKKSPNLIGRKSHGILCLKNVLHVPSMVCNIIGYPIFQDGLQMRREFSKDGKIEEGINDEHGNQLCYFKSTHGLPAIRLSGPPVGPQVGPSSFKPNVVYVLLGLDWPDAERRRWESHTSNQSTGAQSTGISNLHTSTEYTAEEKQWVKDHYGNEFKFLLACGLSIYKDEDREEGRAIVRNLMLVDDDDYGDDAIGDDSEDDLETKVRGHVADYIFSHQELEWINRNWGTSETFMVSYGLKFYKDEDCEEAKTLIRAIMSGD